ncbi:ankyrin repeat domain-containing protein, partial [Acidobacteriota bacterium]
MTKSIRIVLVILALCVCTLPILSQEIFDAVQKGDLTKVKYLVQNNPNLVKANDKNDDTPLHIAADAGHLEIVRFLIQKGADLNSFNSSRRNPVLMAGYNGHQDVVKFLLESGAIFNYVDDRGYSPLRWAAVRGNKDVVELFVSSGAKISIHEAAACGHIGFIDKGLSAGEDINGLNQDGRTPLHQTVYSGNLETIEYLIKKGADVNAKSSNNETPLDLAVESERQEIADVLRSNGGQETPMVEPVVVHVSNNIYRMTFPYEMHSNIGFSSGSEGFLLVDTGFSLRASDKIRATLNSINTHPHWDHIAANSIGATSAIYLVFDKLDVMVSEGLLNREKDSLKGKTGKVFETYYTIKFNGEEIRLIPYPGVHSNGDVLIHFTGSGVVQMGDLLLSQSFPAVGESVTEYLAFLEKVLDIFPEKAQFISGHGRELDMDGVRDYYEMLLSTVEIVKNGIEAGKSIEALQRERVLKEYESYGIL